MIFWNWREISGWFYQRWRLTVSRVFYGKHSSDYVHDPASTASRSVLFSSNSFCFLPDTEWGAQNMKRKQAQWLSPVGGKRKWRQWCSRERAWRLSTQCCSVLLNHSSRPQNKISEVILHMLYVSVKQRRVDHICWMLTWTISARWNVLFVLDCVEQWFKGCSVSYSAGAHLEKGEAAASARLRDQVGAIYKGRVGPCMSHLVSSDL